MTEARPVFTTDVLRIARPAAQLALELPPLALRAGDACALLGPSGAGKTTVLDALLGLGAPGDVICAGARRFEGAPVPSTDSEAWRHWLRHDVVLVPQDARASLDPLQPLLAQVQTATGATADAAVAALTELGVEAAAALVRRYPHEVSGGQAQRVLLAIALLRGARLIVADEPTASLDGARRRELVAAFATLRGEGAALLVATHDATFVELLGARTLTLEAGTVREGLPTAPPWPAPPPLADEAPVVLAARDVAVVRGGQRVLADVTFTLRAGEVLAVVGPSGAGKTSLAFALAGLSAHQGSIERPRARGAVQYLFQDAYASLTPGRSIASLAQETARNAEVVATLAHALGLGLDLLARPAGALSGGERRRAALLRSLTVTPAVLILDEPTASLDARTAVEVMKTIMNLLATARMACVLITHDEGLAATAAHRVLRLERGRPC